MRRLRIINNERNTKMKTSKKSLFTTIATILLACAHQAQAQTDVPSGGAIRRVGEPHYVKIADDDKAMERAVQKARKTVAKLIAALRSPKGNLSRFAIKKPFVEGDKVEHLWLKEVSFDGRLFHGKIDNKPVDLQEVRLGQEVAVAPAEISDWMYVQDGRLVGGYTIHAVCKNMSPAEKKEFEKDSHCQIR